MDELLQLDVLPGVVRLLAATAQRGEHDEKGFGAELVHLSETTAVVGDLVIRVCPQGTSWCAI